MIAITGAGSRIAQELIGLLPAGEIPVHCIAESVPLDADRYLFCAGALIGKRIEEQTPAELEISSTVNFSGPAAAIDRILAANKHARICVVGSESGFVGSYDMAYAGAKAAMHAFIESRKLPSPDQQLVGIAPAIIADSGMTQRRSDLDRLAARAAAHPKGRFLTALEVARTIRFLLYEDRGYISGVVLRMNGGEHASR